MIKVIENRRSGTARIELSGIHATQLGSRAKQAGVSEQEWLTQALLEKMEAANAEAAEIDSEALKRILTPNSAAVVERMVRDHALSTEEVVRAIVDESLHSYEEDIADNGKLSSGQNEWGLVQHANRIAAGRVRGWGFWRNTKHRAGSLSFYSVFGPAQIRKLKKTMGALNPSDKLAA